MRGLKRLSQLVCNGFRYQEKKFEKLVKGDIVLAKPFVARQHLFKLIKFNKSYTCDYGEIRPINCSYFDAVMLDDKRNETDTVTKINAGEGFMNQHMHFNEGTGRYGTVSTNSYLRSNNENQVYNTSIPDLEEGDIIYDTVYTNEDGHLELLEFKTVKYDVIGRNEPEIDSFWLCQKLDSDAKLIKGQEKTAIQGPSVERDIIRLLSKQAETQDFNLKLQDIGFSFDMYYQVMEQ